MQAIALQDMVSQPSECSTICGNWYQRLILKFYPTRPEWAEALSPGQRPGLFWTQTCRPVRAKALKYRTIYKAFALTGRLADCHCTQGDALG